MGWLKYFIAAACFSVVVFFGFGSYFIWTTTQSEKQVTVRAIAVLGNADKAIGHVNATVDRVGSAFSSAAASVSQTEKDVAAVTKPLTGVAAGLQTTVAKLNAECVPGPCGTIENANKLLNTTRLTVGQVEIAANNFDKNEAHFYQQEDVLFVDSIGAVNHFDALLNSKDLADSLHNGAVITGNLGKTTGDFQTKFHDFLYPPPCTKLCGLKMFLTVLKDAGPFVEPAYYGGELVKDMIP